MKKILLLGCIALISIKSFTQINCKSFLQITTAPSNVKIGQLNIKGNKVTLEAVINRTTLYTGGELWAGDIISKHKDVTDVNYLLRPNTAEITTTNGYFRTPDIADIQLNKTYHVAMVYDGSTLTFYRDGCLMSQVPASGDLVQNSWETAIGYFSPAIDKNENFIGYINEVRIWNIARTQAQIQAYMNSSLPNPTTQTGLLAYYTFDNLINKQGNSSWNGTLTGSASINKTNPSCNSILLNCNQPSGNCNNWLKTPSHPSYVQVGQLNVTGDQITVEAVINRATPTAEYPIYNGDIVSKHNTPADVNYLLRSFRTEITTTNGFFTTPWAPDIEPNKNYHIAMVYDGKKLKFYRNGCLVGEADATGNLIQNNWNTRIGDYEPEYNNENFIGYINEVRIWNVARTQAQIQAYMNSSLPNPTIQTGLLAYYTFDNLKNKQGNTAFDGTLGGSATINETNPFCNPIENVCIQNPSDTIIINNYTEVNKYDPCNNALVVTDASKFNIGDTVLVIQMKGAVIDSSNTPNFGIITNYKNSGNYEFNIIKQKTGNSLSLLNSLERVYDIPDGKVQLVRVPYYQNLKLTSTLTCFPWDGSKGGILAFNVANNLELNADIDISAKGFKGGIASTDPAINSHVTDYLTPLDAEMYGAKKGEGIYETKNLLNGRGHLAGGGGGGNASNSGGAGGGNGGKGGDGGNEYDGPFGSIANGGIGGNNFSYNTLTKIFMGSGAGAGQENDNPALASGGNGGGIALISCASISSNGFSIISNGETPAHLKGSNDDGRSGGGAGGTVLLNYTTANDQIKINCEGGNGDNADPNPALMPRHGPGGGGGGGIIWTNKNANDPNISAFLNGGKNGVNTTFNNDPFGATSGDQGLLLKNLVLPVDKTLFQKSIDSLKIAQLLHDCKIFDFKGTTYPQPSSVTSWVWNFGDGNTGNTQNISHAYTTTGNYKVSLTGIDINGCKDSTITTVAIKDITITKSKDTALCGSSAVKIFAAGGTSYSWAPAAGLSNTGIANPVATPLSSTKYFVTVTNDDGCTKKDSIKIDVNSLPVISKSNDTSVCKNTSATLHVAGGTSYEWTPVSSLNNSKTADPVASPAGTTTYNVKVSNVYGCFSNTSIKVDVKTPPVITKSADTTICNKATAKLFVSGGSSYVWTPASTLNNSASPSPIASPLSTTVYHVKITDANSCVFNDSIKVNVRPEAVFSISPDNSVCTNKTQQLSASGGDTYVWSPATFLDNPNVNNPIATANSTITYSVTIKENTCNETATLFTKLTVLPSPDVRASASNDITCSLPASNLSVTGAGTYTWTPSTDLDNPNISTPVATPLSNTLYTVVGKDANGCTGSDTVSVKVFFNGNSLYLLPNSFTPNGDGHNDCFGITYWGRVDQLDFSIYNRWGERVFYTNNSASCWDGTYKGRAQDAGAFVYVIHAKTVCGNIDRKGTIILIR